MRLILTFLFLYIGLFSRGAAAQPMVSVNEYYNVGDVIKMFNCDLGTMNAGPGGAGVTWDFSGVTTTGVTSTTTVLHDTSSVFITSNLLYILPDGKRAHVQENSTHTYINGVYDPGSNLTYTYNSYIVARRPMTYNSNYADTFHVDNTARALNGKGVVTETGDGYGTLKLPNGTFNNVLRIRKHIYETDTVSGSIIPGPTVTSYLWFDTSHHAPLFRVDSTMDVTGASNGAMYLASTERVASIPAQAVATGYFSSNGLIVTSNFERGTTYQMELFNVIGAKLLSVEFSPTGTAVEFIINQPLNPGIYIVTVTPKSNQAEREILKVVKQ